jgi:hypothetical protein
MKSLFLIVALLLGCLLAAPANANDLIAERAIRADAQETLTIDDIVAGAATDFKPTQIIRFRGSPQWIRLRVHAPTEGSKVVLFLRPTYLNDVRLYQADPSAPNGWTTRTTGSDYPYGERDRRRISLGFVINVAAPEETIYIRIESRHRTILNIEALTPLEAEQKDFDRDLLFVFFVTTMTTLLLWAIHSYFLDRQKVFAFFAIHQLVYTLFGISVTGYVAPLLPPQLSGQTDTIGGVVYILIGLTMTLFCRELFKPYTPPRAIRWGFWALIALFSLNCLAFLAGYRASATVSNTIATKLMLIYFVIASFHLRTEGTPRRIVIQAMFAFILINNMAFWIPTYLDINVTVFKWSGIQVLFVDGFLIACLFAVMAYVRARAVRRDATRSRRPRPWRSSTAIFKKRSNGRIRPRPKPEPTS